MIKRPDLLRTLVLLFKSFPQDSPSIMPLHSLLSSRTFPGSRHRRGIAPRDESRKSSFKLISFLCALWISDWTTCAQAQFQPPMGGGPPPSIGPSIPGRAGGMPSQNGFPSPGGVPRPGAMPRGNNSPGSMQPGGGRHGPNIPNSNASTPGIGPRSPAFDPATGRMRGLPEPRGIGPRSAVPDTSRLFARPEVRIPSQTARVPLGALPNTTIQMQPLQGDLSNPDNVRQRFEQQLAGQRSLENLMGAVDVLRQSSQTQGIMRDYQSEARQLAHQQIASGTHSPIPHTVIAKLALESGNHAEFRQSAQALMRAFPQDKHAQYFDGISKLQDGNYRAAVASLKKARAMGVPEESINAYLKLAIDGQKWIWEYTQILLWVLGLWCCGLIALRLVGGVLSHITLKQSQRLLQCTSGQTGWSEKMLRGVYRWVIAFAGIYYYISLPLLVASAILLPLSICYALLFLPSISLPLIFFVAIIGVGGVLTAIGGLKTLFTQTATDVPGQPIPREAAPELWRVLDEVAQRVGTRTVDQVRLLSGTAFAVTETGTAWQKYRDDGERILLIGAAALDGFSLAAFRAVLAHEFGHFAHRDTAGGNLAFRVMDSMIRFAQSIESRGKVRFWHISVQFLRLYHRLFSKLSFGASRLQEILADRLAIQTYGAEAFCQGLQHVIRRGVEFDVILNDAFQTKYQDADARLSFFRMGGELEIDARDAVHSGLQSIFESVSTELDTHPSPKERIAFAKRFTNPSDRMDSAQVWDLIPQRENYQSGCAKEIRDYIDTEAVQSRSAAREMLKILNKHLEQQPNDAPFLMERARIQRGFGNYQDALNDLSSILRSHPRDMYPLVYRAIVLEEMGRHQEAAYALEALPSTDPDIAKDFDFHYRLGKLRMTLGQPELACQALIQAVTLSPNRLGPRILLMRAWEAQGDLQRAQRECTTILQLDPKDPEAKAWFDAHPCSWNVVPVEVVASPASSHPSADSKDAFAVTEPVRAPEFDAAQKPENHSSNWAWWIFAPMAPACLYLASMATSRPPVLEETDPALNVATSSPRDPSTISDTLATQPNSIGAPAIELPSQPVPEVAQAPVLTEAMLRRQMEKSQHQSLWQQQFTMIGQAVAQLPIAADTPIIAQRVQCKDSPLSWRVHLLPKLGYQILYDKFHLNEPWDSPHNLELLPLMPPQYASSRSATNWKTQVRSQLRLDGDYAALHRCNEITDGAAYTAFCFIVDPKHAIEWTKPDASKPVQFNHALNYHDRNGEYAYLIRNVPVVGTEGIDARLIDALLSHDGGELVVAGPLNSFRLLDTPIPPDSLNMPTPTKASGDRSSEALTKDHLQRVQEALSKWSASRIGIPFNQRGLSWRVHLLPYLGRSDLYGKFNFEEPWTSEHNLALLPQIPDVYRLPHDHPFMTRIRPVFVEELDGYITTPSEDRDADSETITLAMSGSHRAMYWTAPDAPYSGNESIASFLGWPEPGKGFVVLADGKTLEVPSTLHSDTWRMLTRVHDTMEIDVADALEHPETPPKLRPKRNRNPAPTRISLPAGRRSDQPTDAAGPPPSPDLDRQLLDIAWGIESFESSLLRSPAFPFENKGRGLSWRVHILPKIQQQDLYAKFRLDEPWDSPHNLTLLDSMPEMFRSPGLQPGHTPFLMPYRQEHLKRHRDPARQIMLVAASDRLATPWTKPQDIDVDTLKSLQELTDGSSIPMVLYDMSRLDLPVEYPLDLLQGLTSSPKPSRLFIDPGMLRRHIAGFLNQPIVQNEQKTHWEMKQMRALALGALNYEAANKRFPPGGAAGNPSQESRDAGQLSWRVMILPQLGFTPLFEQFRMDEPWDSPHNLSLLPYMPDVFRDLDDPCDSTTTRVLSVTGPDTAFPNPHLGPKFSNITDDLSSTILFLRAPQSEAVPWTQPSDLNLKRLEMLRFEEPIQAAMFDAKVIALPQSIDPSTLRALITPSGTEDVQAFLAELGKP